MEAKTQATSGVTVGQHCGLLPKNILPYMGVSFDKYATFDTPTGYRKFRIIVYQAYNAYGLIGPEMNGVAIFDDDSRSVLCDGICKQQTGYFGASPLQIKTADGLIGMDWENFKYFVNNQKSKRHDL